MYSLWLPETIYENLLRRIRRNTRTYLKNYAHQLIAIKFHLSRNYSMNASSPGTGKTRVAILTALSRIKHSNVDKVLIVCPNSLLWTWRDEIWKHGNRKSIVVTGDKVEKLRRLDLRGKLFIINYESTIIKPIFQKIQDLNFGMGIWDESTYLKNPQSKRSQMNYIIGDALTFRLMLTGTPITDSILDIYSQYKVLDGGATFGANYYKFFRYLYRPVLQYIPKKTRYFMGGYWLPKIGAGKAIQQKVAPSLIRFKAEDCLDLPERIFIKRYAEWNKKSEQYTDYQDVNKELVTSLTKSLTTTLDQLLFEENILKVQTAGTLRKMMKLQQICSGFLYGADSLKAGVLGVYNYNTNPKIDALCEILEEYLSAGKIIVYGQFVHDKQLIRSTPFKKYMTDNIDEFLSITQRNIYVGTTLTAGIGLNLQAANIMIFFNNHWGLEKRVQALGRIHRIGQKKKCIYIDLMMRDSIDEHILDKLENKWETAEAILRYLQSRHGTIS